MDADELVRRHIMRQYRTDWEHGAAGWPPERNAHLADCAEAFIEQAEVNGARWYDTGVTGTEFTAVITCPHGVRHEFEFGQYGNLSEILEDMDYDEAGGYPDQPK